MDLILGMIRFINRIIPAWSFDAHVAVRLEQFVLSQIASEIRRNI